MSLRNKDALYDTYKGQQPNQNTTPERYTTVLWVTVYRIEKTPGDLNLIQFLLFFYLFMRCSF